jgi:hypothetical protein
MDKNYYYTCKYRKVFYIINIITISYNKRYNIFIYTGNTVKVFI